MSLFILCLSGTLENLMGLSCGYIKELTRVSAALSRDLRLTLVSFVVLLVDV